MFKKLIPVEVPAKKSKKNDVLEDTYYPDLEDPEFLEKVVTKREFWKTRITLEPTTMEEQCRSDKPFRLLPQQEFLKNFINIDTPYNGILIYHGVGVGKCHARNTPILMYDGHIKMVQDVEEGDLLMGDDSTPRQVLSLARGRDTMYRIIPTDNGNSFTVNKEHILVLKDINNDIHEMTVIQYLSLSYAQQKQLKLYRVAVEFPKELHEELTESPETIAKHYDTIDGHIPSEILYNSLSIRKRYIDELLKIIGYPHDNHYQVHFRTKNLSEKLKFLARSCGYGAFDKYQNPTQKPIFDEIVEIYGGDYVNETRFECLELGEGDYFGFTLSGNCRYLLGDFLVTHNTCSAIQIAKGFKDVLRRIHGGSDSRKIMVLVPGDKLRDNFKKELFNPAKAISTKSKLSAEQILSLEGETRQCTGDTYEIPEAEARLLDARRIERRIDRMIRNDYKFVNHQKFASDVISLIGGWDLKLDSLTEQQKAKINKNFRNRILIVDEIHNIRANENNRVPPVLEAVIRYADNIRLVMMTATPMVDDPREIVYLVNLLLLNDRRQEMDRNEIFDSYGNLLPGGSDLLQKASLGYVSYLRGERPDTFPLRIEPNGVELIPGVLDWKGYPLTEDEKMHYQKLMPVEMSPEQYNVYQDAWKTYSENSNNNNNNNNNNHEVEDVEGNVEETDNEEAEEGKMYLPFINLSNIWIPTGEKNGFAKKKDEAFSTKVKPNVAFQLLQRTDPRSKKRYRQILYQKLALVNPGTKDETSILNEKYLPTYSTKYANVLDLTRSCRGVVMIYSSYLWFGVYPMAMVLEQNGFQRYLETGDQPLLNYPRNRAGGGGVSETICAYCGKTRKDGDHVLLKEAPKLKPEEYPGDYPHVFKPARYAMVTGETTFDQLRSVLTQPENRWGGEIKVIIGSSAIAEGVNLFYIRQTHLLEPRYNWAKMEQIIGRATRTCSHVALPQKDRTVEVYFWTAIPPNSATEEEKNTELVNHRYYRKAEMKDRKIKAVEYLLKTAAVDCYLNKAGNLFLAEDMEKWLGFKGGKLRIQNSIGEYKVVKVGDEPYSRMCEYRPSCEYRCVWEPDRPNHLLSITSNTYSLQHARSAIDETKRWIRQLYLHSPAYTLEGIEQALRLKVPGGVERPILYQALEEFLVPGKEFLSDPYHRRGYLIYRGRYYVWQPVEVSNKSIPLHYRRIPLRNKTKAVPMPTHREAINENEEVENMAEADMVAIVIEKASAMLEGWASNYNSKKYQHQILISMVLDRLMSYREHFLVIRDVYLKGVEKQVFNDPWLEGIVHYYNRIWIGDFTAKKTPKGFYWEGVFHLWDAKKNELVQTNITNAPVAVERDFRKRQESFGPVGVVSNTEMKQTGRVWRENIPRNVIFGFMEFFRKKEWVFKIVDKTRETGEQTQEAKRSKRSESRGKKCGNYPLKDLRDIMSQIGFTVDSSSIGTICDYMEYHLRLKDLESKNKRWMLTALEILLANM